MSIVIRKANRKDSTLILRFVKELARYEKAEHEVLATESSIERSIFGKNSSTKAIICEKIARLLVLLFTFLTILRG